MLTDGSPTREGKALVSVAICQWYLVLTSDYAPQEALGAIPSRLWYYA